MALPQPGARGYTLSDWERWEGRWELIRGAAHDLRACPCLGHERVSMRLTRAIAQGLEEARRQGHCHGCEVFFAPLDVYLGEDVVAPDLVVVCDPARKVRRGIEGAPDVVVEILGPPTAAKDALLKREVYGAAGVPEYLIVDPEARESWLLRLEGGAYGKALSVAWGSTAPLLGGRLPVALG